MATYYAFLNDEDICTIVAYPDYEPVENVLPYEYLDYSTENTQCIPLPSTIEDFQEATEYYYGKQYNRDTQTWSIVPPESKTDDVSEYESSSDFPQRGDEIESDPYYDKIYIAKDTNKTYRWDTAKRAYVEINANITVINNLTSTSTVNALSAAQGKVLNDNKIDKVSGKQLSTNDYTTAEKNKLAGIAAGANQTTIVNNLTSTSTTSALSAAQGKVLNEKFVVKSPSDTTEVQTINSPVTINGVLRSAYGQIYYATDSSATISTNNLNLTIAADETCAINATTTQTYNIAPRGSNAYDLGTSSLRFKNIYLNNTPNISSDKKTKKDIKPINNQEMIDFLTNVDICNFKYIDDDTNKERIGVIAQQLIDINPEMAKYFVDHNPETDLYSIRPSDLVFPLIAYVQYLHEELLLLRGYMQGMGEVMK